MTSRRYARRPARIARKKNPHSKWQHTAPDASNASVSTSTPANASPFHAQSVFGTSIANQNHQRTMIKGARSSQNDMSNTDIATNKNKRKERL
jgi:hypothetical protein